MRRQRTQQWQLRGHGKHRTHRGRRGHSAGPSTRADDAVDTVLVDGELVVCLDDSRCRRTRLWGWDCVWRCLGPSRCDALVALSVLLGIPRELDSFGARRSHSMALPASASDAGGPPTCTVSGTVTGQ
jgi:hypothetical protein